MEGRGKRMKQEAYFCTVKELNELGKEQIPDQLISHTHLIYSSPATLACGSGFNYADRISRVLWT